MAGIYIHVPFCKTRCIYCDFYTRTDFSSKNNYVEAVCKELEIRKDYIGQESVKTIYFGGGTPSQLSYSDFIRIFETIDKNFQVEADAEITMEANPDDLSDKYLHSINELPINRLSVGIQSFDDNELLFLKRRHSAKKAIEVISQCKSFGYENISIDLMYGLPNQTISIWEQNLETAISLDIQHISSYHLIYEQGAKLYRMFKTGDVNSIDEELSVDMFSLMIDMLSNTGFEHYEISNFAKDNLYSKHNSSYWKGQKYLGVGPAAHSCDGHNRAWNIASIAKYIDGINSGHSVLEIEYLDKNTQYNDYILTGLRTKWGVDIYELESKYGTRLSKYCLDIANKYLGQGYLTFHDNVLKLTREGIFISDGIMSDLMWVE